MSFLQELGQNKLISRSILELQKLVQRKVFNLEMLIQINEETHFIIFCFIKMRNSQSRREVLKNLLLLRRVSLTIFTIE